MQSTLQPRTDVEFIEVVGATLKSLRFSLGIESVQFFDYNASNDHLRLPQLLDACPKLEHLTLEIGTSLLLDALSSWLNADPYQLKSLTVQSRVTSGQRYVEFFQEATFRMPILRLYFTNLSAEAVRELQLMLEKNTWIQHVEIQTNSSMPSSFAAMLDKISMAVGECPTSCRLGFLSVMCRRQSKEQEEPAPSNKKRKKRHQPLVDSETLAHIDAPIVAQVFSFAGWWIERCIHWSRTSY